MGQRTKRLAVVIGNSEYQNLSGIPNAARDAEAIQETLKTLGFEVSLGLNQERKGIFERFINIRNTWKDEATEIVVYYSGHGISIDGKVYICPVDADEIEMDFIHYNLLELDGILKVLLKHRKEEKNPIIVILDCCRSAFGIDSTRGYDQDPLRGVSGENNPKWANIAILYSTAEGNVALDGDSSNGHSPYTKLLLENMIKDYTVDQIHSTITKFLGHGKQIPWMYQSLYEPYKFCLTAPQESPIVSLIAKDSVKKRFYGVPHRNKEFINRPNILAEIEAALSEKPSLGGGNILALRGLGGMGKTQLMLHYCYLHRSSYDYIFWLEVDGWILTLDSFHQLAINLGLDEESAKEKCTDKRIIEWVSDWLEKRKGWLLLLNNTDETTINKTFTLLPRIGGNVILTTREHISPKKAKIINVGKMDEREALSLLFGANEMDSVDYESARYNNAKKIIAELGSMALAVDLARAYVESMSISFKDYLSMFRTQRDILFSHQDKDNSHQYNHSLKTVWQISLERIRGQSLLAAEILDACSFLQPERIPVRLFKRQYFLLTRSFDLSSLTSSETDVKVLEAISLLARFSFVTRKLNEDREREEDPASDFLEIHRLVQTVIHDAMSDEQRIYWAHNLPSALKNETAFSDSYASLTRTIMNSYLPHIFYFAKMLDINRTALLSEDLCILLVNTVTYLLDNGVYFGTEELAKLAVSISEVIYEPETISLARSLYCLGRLYKNQSCFIKAEPLYQQVLTIHQRVLGPEHSFTATSLNNLASLYKNQGNYAKAELLYQRALEISEKLSGLEQSEHPPTATFLNNLASLYYSQHNYAKAEPLYQRALEINEKVFGAEHPETATSLNNLALLYKGQGNYAKSESLYQQALAIHEKAFGPYGLKTAASLNNLASLNYSQGNYHNAELLYQRALAISEELSRSEHSETVIILNNLALIYCNQSDYSKAEPLYQRVLHIREKMFGLEHPETATAINNLALLYTSQGNYDKAEPLYQRTLAICESGLGPNHLETAASLNNLALLYDSQGSYTKAEPLYKRTLKISERILGPEHPFTAVSLDNLASLYCSIGDYTIAEKLLQRALAIRKKVFGHDHLFTATSLYNLASLYHCKGDYTKSELLYQETLAIREAILGHEHPVVAASLNKLALLYKHQCDYTKAGLIYQRALKIREKMLGPEHLETATSLNNLASLYYSLGNYAKAELLFQRALAIRRKVLGSDHLFTATSLYNLASLYYCQSNYAKAEPLYQQVLTIREKALGPDHPVTSMTMDMLASFYDDKSKYDKV